ncbi:disintegrin and metalloproteinase domain-containing protein 29-like [Mustela erminea]|uniref:disintegrin and metalloproteinase domain-containing protein 29-like n=1 Tax=Mustela erminea TaxID=36723 RepID=UPI001387149C|nr:disintegrin and metalloproteinase domain-containing protein 29-like [Mustela erminea]
MKALLLLLAVWAGLAPVQCSQGRPSWRYISSEVVIPRKELYHGKGVRMPGWLSYSLRFGDKRHIIHMRRKKLFWSRHLLMMTQDDQGALQMDYPFIPPDYYYLGYLEEIPLSMVTVDTCYGGLEGILKMDDLAYEIKPLSNSQRFTSGSKCNTGRCCTNCTYSPPGTLCRPIQNICDLPEYCRGKSLACPDDFYMQDGTPCTEVGYCYHGNCTDRNVHCQEIFGKNAVKGSDACYIINRRGNRYGHCSRKEELMKPNVCAIGDIYCGRLQCGNVTHLPRLQEHVGFHQSLISGFWCFGLDSHRSTGANDVGHVRTGTPCDHEKICIDGFCIARDVQLKYDCLPEKCSHRGICNNNKNCHCHIGWDPPRCIDRGAGGSTDSGHPPRKMRSVRQSNESLIYLRVVFGRIYALIAVFLFGVATNVRTIKTVKVVEEKADEVSPDISLQTPEQQ